MSSVYEGSGRWSTSSSVWATPFASPFPSLNRSLNRSSLRARAGVRPPMPAAVARARAASAGRPSASASPPPPPRSSPLPPAAHDAAGQAWDRGLRLPSVTRPPSSPVGTLNPSSSNPPSPARPPSLKRAVKLAVAKGPTWSLDVRRAPTAPSIRPPPPPSLSPYASAPGATLAARLRVRHALLNVRHLRRLLRRVHLAELLPPGASRSVPCLCPVYLNALPPRDPSRSLLVRPRAAGDSRLSNGRRGPKRGRRALLFGGRFARRGRGDARCLARRRGRAGIGGQLDGAVAAASAAPSTHVRRRRPLALAVSDEHLGLNLLLLHFRVLRRLLPPRRERAQR